MCHRSMHVPCLCVYGRLPEIERESGHSSTPIDTVTSGSVLWICSLCRPMRAGSSTTVPVRKGYNPSTSFSSHPLLCAVRPALCFFTCHNIPSMFLSAMPAFVHYSFLSRSISPSSLLPPLSLSLPLFLSLWVYLSPSLAPPLAVAANSIFRVFIARSSGDVIPLLCRPLRCVSFPLVTALPPEQRTTSASGCTRNVALIVHHFCCSVESAIISPYRRLRSGLHPTPYSFPPPL